MARVSVEVPEKLVERVRDTVLHLYAATAESLALALREEDAPPRTHRARLAALDDLLASLEAPARAHAVILTAERDLIHDVLYGTLIDAGERLAGVSERCWRGELPPERIGEAAEELLALDALLGALDATS